LIYCNHILLSGILFPSSEAKASPLNRPSLRPKKDRPQVTPALPLASLPAHVSREKLERALRHKLSAETIEHGEPRRIPQLIAEVAIPNLSASVPHSGIPCG